jgi:multidrug efflux pump
MISKRRAVASANTSRRLSPTSATSTLRARGHSARDAALRSAVLRLRPVLLTSFTTVLGLMPMVLAMNVDLVGRSISFGAPSTQWWTELSSAIAGGLTFATLLTLILTPCLLVLGARIGERVALWRGETSRPAPALPSAA